MGIAIDTIQYFSTQAGAAAFPTALATAQGDPAQIRNFNTAKKAWLHSFIYSAGGGQKARITSPLLHDNVTGLTFQPGEIPANFLIPAMSGVQVHANDTPLVSGGIAGAGTITAGLQVYYEDLDGAAARLFHWKDIEHKIKAYKSLEVSLAAIAVGAWTDTKITITEDQLHADSYYAVIGYNVDPAVDLVGVKGSATANLRVCGPGPVSTLDISNYYAYMSIQANLPFVPVFNANDKGAFYVSAANHAAVAANAAEVYLFLAELDSRP